MDVIHHQTPYPNNAKAPSMPAAYNGVLSMCIDPVSTSFELRPSVRIPAAPVPSGPRVSHELVARLAGGSLWRAKRKNSMTSTVSARGTDTPHIR